MTQAKKAVLTQLMVNKFAADLASAEIGYGNKVWNLVEAAVVFGMVPTVEAFNGLNSAPNYVSALNTMVVLVSDADDKAGIYKALTECAQAEFGPIVTLLRDTIGGIGSSRTDVLQGKGKTSAKKAGTKKVTAQLVKHVAVQKKAVQTANLKKGQESKPTTEKVEPITVKARLGVHMSAIAQLMAEADYTNIEAAGRIAKAMEKNLQDLQKIIKN